METREVMCLKFDSFVIILNHEQLASTKVFALFFFHFQGHIGLRNCKFRELANLVSILCIFTGT